MSSVSFSVDREATARPLCVDLDGTLVRSDLLIEAIFVLLKQNLFMLFNLFRWLRRGKAHFKQQIAERDLARTVRFNLLELSATVAASGQNNR